MNDLNRILCFFILIFCVACNNQTKSTIEEQPVKDAFIESLIEKQILENQYAISIPPDYYIDTLDAADFVVYYIQPIDTSISTLAAGIYFGNHPSCFNYGTDSSKITTIEREILRQNAEWTVYNRDTVFSVQTLIETPNAEYWRDYIHAFGVARTESDLDKLFKVFSTFTELKPDILPDSVMPNHSLYQIQVE